MIATQAGQRAHGELPVRARIEQGRGPLSEILQFVNARKMGLTD